MENLLKSAEVPTPACLNPATPEHWRVLLAEFVHLLGLLMIHSRHAPSARATSLLYDQMLRHMSILENMPDHEGALMLSCGDVDGVAKGKGVSYRVIFGNVILERTAGGNGVRPIAGEHANYLNNALDQTFEYLLAYGIKSLYLQLPGDSDDRIDQFRLALNIIARFRDAADNQSLITFRYSDRGFTVPLIENAQGEADFNLTLLAGINGLSAANADELIKQAQAFHDLALAAKEDSTRPLRVLNDSYDQIFMVRSLRSQIIKPLVEINKIPWIGDQADHGKGGEGRVEISRQTDKAAEPDTTLSPKVLASHGPLFVKQTVDNLADASLTRRYLTRYLGEDDLTVCSDFDAVITNTYRDADTLVLGQRLVAASRLLYCIEKKSQDPVVVDRLLYFLKVQLRQVSGQVLANIAVLRQGLKFVARGRSMVVGLVHPRLVDMITLVKDLAITRYKIALIRKIAFGFDPQYTAAVADRFAISIDHAQYLLDLFRECFDAQGSFNRDAFELGIDGMAQQANAFFEVNWCFIKQTPRGEDRLAFLNAIQLLMVRLTDPKQALRFLLDDLCRNSDRVFYADRNAFVLANILIQAENKTLHEDLDLTPDATIDHAHEVDRSVHKYALWRINTDHIPMVDKIKTIHHALERNLKLSADQRNAPVDFLLALEREALIFLTLVNGPVARRILSGLLKLYGDSKSAIYSYALACGRLTGIAAQLKIIIRCLGWVGYPKNIPLLQAVADNSDALLSLDAHPAYAEQIKQATQGVPEAINRIVKQTS